ncbi:ShlB/FhaC/HecB family hemolysin secretion/activation protein [Chamaesiphon sp. VAR_48_metabat_403]|uniref:ShlB/FhaC/HecB family hemolysin secretion/activation protein n=1 Tax=Chamaesiphon sp. VAR_48_metabat_403 TaxID=2964700 RepID=UPI00286E7228|nr:ShlB/FhaC/HecB family hemolysin secretion/activation protein [Chamaesiphon sp. VAR_48_metabat_403]
MKLLWLWSILFGASTVATMALPVLAQTPTDPNTDRFPQTSPTPAPLPSDSTPKPTITPSSEPGSPDDGKSVVISEVNVIGSTVLTDNNWGAIVKPLVGQTKTIAELKTIADRLTQLYLDRGEITSRVVVVTPIDGGKITFQAIEGSVEQINILGLKKLKPEYIRSRLALVTKTPLNVNKLEDQLRLLRTDPLVSNIEASLKAGSGVGKSILTVRTTEANPLSVNLTADNYSPPSVGSERVGASIEYRDPTGELGSIDINYNRTLPGGSDLYDFSYKIPLNPMQGTLQARIAPNSSQITTPQFQNLNFKSRSQLYELSYRQPFVRSLREEFALSWGIALQKNEISTGNTPIPFIGGSDAQGVSQTTVLKFGQDYVKRDPRGAWGVRSLLNFGVGIFGATINNKPTPDGRFFSWQGQVQRVQILSPDQLLIAQLDAQLTPNALLPIQQFAIGGGQSVRGFRQNARAADNGVKLSLEDRITIGRDPAGNQTLAIAPFVDAGWVWNQGDNPNPLPRQNFIAGLGLGVIWQPLPRLNLRVDYGLPLVNLSDRGNNIQDSGLYFSVNYQP